MYQNNYSRSPTLEEVEWEDGSKKGKHSPKCNIDFKLCLPKMLGRGGGGYAGILERGLIPLCLYTGDNSLQKGEKRSLS